MLSLKTCIELINLIDNYVVSVVDRIFVVFDIEHLIHPTIGRFTKDDKVNILLKTLKCPPTKGPYTESFQLDILQCMVDHFYRFEAENGSNRYVSFDPNYGTVSYEDRFSYKNLPLANTLKRDGYIIKKRTIKKMLPDEIE